MACEFFANQVQQIGLNQPILFTESIPCSKGYVYHPNGTGSFVLRGIVNNPCNNFAHYQVTFNGNISVPEGGAVTAISVAIAVNGEVRPTSRAIFTPQAVDEYGNVTATAIIKVPKGCCFNVAVEYAQATDSTTVEPTPFINVQNSNLVISRIA